MTRTDHCSKFYLVTSNTFLSQIQESSACIVRERLQHQLIHDRHQKDEKSDCCDRPTLPIGKLDLHRVHQSTSDLSEKRLIVDVGIIHCTE